MSFEELQRSVEHDPSLPGGLTPAVQALWHDARGNWDAAHDCAQEDHSFAGSWVHAYLHRKEGDIGNAGYWYTRAGRKAPASGVTLSTEWSDIARALLGK